MPTDNQGATFVKKSFQIEVSTGKIIEPIIFEVFTASAPPHFTWASALVLASFVVAISETFKISEKTFLEIGAGSALPSVTAALLGAKRVIITDRYQADLTIQTVFRALEANCIASICEILPLNWRDSCTLDSDAFPSVDFILGSDVFYSSEDLDSIIFTVAVFMHKNPNTIFYTSYQERRFAIIYISISHLSAS